MEITKKIICGLTNIINLIVNFLTVLGSNTLSLIYDCKKNLHYMFLNENNTEEYLYEYVDLPDGFYTKFSNDMYFLHKKIFKAKKCFFVFVAVNNNFVLLCYAKQKCIDGVISCIYIKDGFLSVYRNLETLHAYNRISKKDFYKLLELSVFLFLLKGYITPKDTISYTKLKSEYNYIYWNYNNCPIKQSKKIKEYLQTIKNILKEDKYYKVD